MTDKETKTVKGIVEATGDKFGPSVKMKGEKNWYTNKYFKGTLPKKGDEVEIILEKNVSNDKVYWNLRDIKVLKATQTKEETNSEVRVFVDAGNCLQRATDLVVAGKGGANLMATTVEVIAAFKYAVRELKATPEPLENPETKEGGDSPDEEVEF